MNFYLKTKKTFNKINVIPTIKNGIITLFSCHTTCSLAILEDEKFLIKDMEELLEKFASKDNKYRHDDIKRRNVPLNERINGFSHLRTLLFSPSISIPVENSKLCLGKWQSIFVVELDPCRDRKIIIKEYEC